MVWVPAARQVHGNVAQCFSEIMTLVTTVEVLMPARDPVLDRLRRYARTRVDAFGWPAPPPQMAHARTAPWLHGRRASAVCSKETATSVLQGAFKADAPNRVSAIYNALSFLTELVLKHTRCVCRLSVCPPARLQTNPNQTAHALTPPRHLHARPPGRS